MLRTIKPFILLPLLLCLVSFAAYAAAPLTQVAFDYSDTPSVEQLKHYQVSVIDPSAPINPKTFNTPDHQVFAYVTVGEIDAEAPYRSKIDPKWIVGRNEHWNSDVVDESNPAWQKFFLDQVITPLWNRGFRGFFLDTLDSYEIVAKTPEEKMKQEQGIVNIIKMIKQKYPDAKLIANRGFVLMPQIHQDLYAVAAESLFHAWKPATKRYQPMSKEATQWLLTQLNTIKKQYQLPIIVIDYYPAHRKKAATADAKRIRELGFIPWISTAHLDTLVLNQGNTIPREILIIYNASASESLMQSQVVKNIATPINYLGYVTTYQDINKPLPRGDLSKKYAGVVVWLNSSNIGVRQGLRAWVLKQIKAGIHVVFFNNFGFPATNGNLRAFGLSVPEGDYDKSRLRVLHKSPIMGYEMKVYPNRYAFSPLKIKRGISLLTLANMQGYKQDAAGITPWGGYVLNPYDLIYLPNGMSRWVINPLVFLKTALKLPDMPVPDTTTENGRRILMAEIDGDGFISVAEFDPEQYAAQIILNRVLKRYRIPTTVSVITGEVGPKGLYARDADKYMATAREIFQLPWVEIASHTYSHPFDWMGIEEKANNGIETYADYNLPIKGYKFSLQDEITGSIDFINKELAPADKKTKVFLWSGDTNPSAKALALTYENKVGNMNGGDTIMTEANNSLTEVAPLGVPKGNYFQIFAPNQNENVYTNDWLGPFYGYENVIETFKLTDEPLRFKPIDIYYHFYSGTKVASLKALIKVYDWALAQQTFPMYVSQYIKNVLDFNGMKISKSGKAWTIHSKGNLRELRAPQSLGFPDLNSSTNVLGFNKHGKDYYIHLGPAKTSQISFSKQAPSEPYIVNTNATVTSYHSTGTKTDINLQGHTPIELTLANMNSCKLMDNGQAIQGQKMASGFIVYKLANKDEHAINIHC